jgi:hypothetical protein
MAADEQRRYWDVEQCGWVPSPTLADAEIPAPRVALEALEELDVRSE